jgi:hypothetical protein
LGAIGAALVGSVAVLFGQQIMSEFDRRKDARDVASAPYETPTADPAALPETAAPPVRTPPPAPASPTTQTAPTQPFAELDACVAGLGAFCPAPKPTAGFAADGKLSAQETALISSVDPNFSASNPKAVQRCHDVTAKLRGVSAERLKAGAFGQTCARLAPVRIMSPGILKDRQIQLQKAQPEQIIR